LAQIYGREGGREDSPCRVAGRWVGEASREIPGGTGPTFPSGGPRRAGEAGDPRRQEEEAASSLFPPSLSLSLGGWLVGWFPARRRTEAVWRAGQASNGRSAGQWAPPAAAVAGRRGVGRSPAAGEGKGGAEGERERGWEGRGGEE
jgi:hypothetical protein